MSKNSIKNYFQKRAISPFNTDCEESASVPKIRHVENNASNSNCEESASPPQIRHVEIASQAEVPNDIANFGKKLSDQEKYLILTSAWLPDASFSFPSSGDRNLKFQRNWFNLFSWLLYSAIKDDAYCRYCFGFGWDTVGHGSYQKSNAFVQTPFRNWKRAIEKFKEHQLREYHKKAVENAANFKPIYENKKIYILSQIDQQRQRQQIAQNQILA